MAQNEAANAKLGQAEKVLRTLRPKQRRPWWRLEPVNAFVA